MKTYRPATLVLWMFVLLVLLGGCAAEKQDQKKSNPGVPVTVVTVRSKTMTETVTGIGTIQADKVVQATPEVSGVIERIHFREGDTVSEGDILVELDDDKLQQQYEARRHALQEARAALQNAQKTYQRNKKLHEKNLISDQSLDDSREVFESAQARVQQARARLKEARARLEDTTIRAPFAGSVGARMVDTGNFVQPGQTLVTLYKTDRVEVSFTVAERFAGRIHRGQSVRVHVDAYPNTEFHGTVFFVSPSVREVTRDILVKARLNNPDRVLKPGSYARAQLVLETLRNRPTVPAESLISTRQGYIVYRIEDGKAVRQPVKIGLRNPGVVEIRDGLSPGDRVIRSGHMSVSDGTRVNITTRGDTSGALAS